LALHAPPFEIVQRLDLALFDLWSRVGSPAPPRDVVLVRVDSTDDLGPLIDIATDANARLVVATLTQPPAALSGDFVVGPVDVPVGAALRRTEWQQGGHLSFEPGIDGRVRYDLPELRAESNTPSLGAFAAERAAVVPAASADVRAGDRRWLRFYSRESFP